MDFLYEDLGLGLEFQHVPFFFLSQGSVAANSADGRAVCEVQLRCSCRV